MKKQIIGLVALGAVAAIATTSNSQTLKPSATPFRRRAIPMT